MKKPGQVFTDSAGRRSYVTQLVDRTWLACHLHFPLNILLGAVEGRKQAEDCKSLLPEPKQRRHTEKLSCVLQLQGFSGL